MSEFAIEVKGLSKSFGELEVLKDVSFSVKKGETIVIIGSSGCGKSVMLRCIEHIVEPDEGEIYIDGELTTGKNINAIHKKVGMVYQTFNLFSNMNVMDNLCLAPCKLNHLKREDAEKKALEWLDKVGLRSKAYEMTQNLSGGQKQRIAIVRCLMMDPDILLFDEPTSALDASMVSEVLATIRLLSKYGITMMIVTHELLLAREIAHRVFFMADKGVYEQGSPAQILDNPQKEQTISFINRLKELNLSINDKDFDLIELQGKIITFAQKYGISSIRSYRMQICTEELINEYLIVNKNENICIDIRMKYYEAVKLLEIEFAAKGKPMNPFELEDGLVHLGVTIIKRTAKEYQYSYEDGTNYIKLLFE